MVFWNRKKRKSSSGNGPSTSKPTGKRKYQLLIVSVFVRIKENRFFSFGILFFVWFHLPTKLLGSNVPIFMVAGRALRHPRSGLFGGNSMTTDGVDEKVVPEVVPEVKETADVAVEAVQETETFEAKEKPAEKGTWERRPKYNGDREDSDYDKRKPRKRGAGDAVLCKPLEVVVRDDRVEQAIRQLKNRMAREGVLRELKNRRHYSKPSELKRIKSRDAARRRRKEARQKKGQ
jgi:small subunit ribosomal protein S21